MSYNELLDIVCSHVQIDRATVNVNLVLYYTFQGVPLTSNLFGDEGVNMLYYLAASQINFIADIFVTWDPKIVIQPTSMMDLLRGFSASQSYVSEMGSPTHVDNQLIFQQPADEEQEDADEKLEDADEEIQDEDDTQEDGDTEDSEVPPSDRFSNGPTEDYDEAVELRDCQLPDYDDEDHMDIWNPNANQIRVGMFFKKNEAVVCVVRQWNVACNREIIVSESRPNVWRPNATQEVKNTVIHFQHPLMSLGCKCMSKKNQYMWQLTKWVDTHNCYGTVVRNNNRCLKSKDVAAHISRLIQSDISLLVKQICAYIKDTLHVDVSYSKAWLGRRKAIENIHGSWDTNFVELPSYMRELQNRNNGTIVQWFHRPHGTSQCATYKYMFCAFKPSIDAFHLCQPVISIDRTHLKGPYRSKLLIVVSKNANNYILPVAYAIVMKRQLRAGLGF
ncbi:hypothetical protein E3N88_45728 [Mikania micrantha]|uniref:Transposase MuDR plant domain-containing protein n=1 Tax=Mikania micrantha TaxID=192012 RepID=A0A5N6L8A3_9ASTR|nr:hypothetical protein E3N88_45728 [Mikania micrantha]